MAGVLKGFITFLACLVLLPGTSGSAAAHPAGSVGTLLQALSDPRLAGDDSSGTRQRYRQRRRRRGAHLQRLGTGERVHLCQGRHGLAEASHRDPAGSGCGERGRVRHFGGDRRRGDHRRRPWHRVGDGRGLPLRHGDRRLADGPDGDPGRSRACRGRRLRPVGGAGRDHSGRGCPGGPELTRHRLPIRHGNRGWLWRPRRRPWPTRARRGRQFRQVGLGRRDHRGDRRVRAASFAGAAHVYLKGASGWPAVPAVTLHNPRPARQSFGFAVAVSGTAVVVGGPTPGMPGIAYIYAKGASGWPAKPTVTLTDDVTAPRSSARRSRYRVRRHRRRPGDLQPHQCRRRVLLRQGRLRLASRPDGGGGAVKPRRRQDFGAAVAVSGPTAVIGPRCRSGRGKAYIYQA